MCVVPARGTKYCKITNELNSILILGAEYDNLFKHFERQRDI